MKPILYSTNPWFSHDVATRYLGGRHFIWCCEYFDISKAPAGSAAAHVPPSSTPKVIYDQLQLDVDAEDRHSNRIAGYRKTFARLARSWYSSGVVSDAQKDEIIAAARQPSWKIWRPLLYVIPVAPIAAGGRLLEIKADLRAAHGPELQIIDLMPHEFDILEFD